jgi:hypothetical protein
MMKPLALALVIAFGAMSTGCFVHRDHPGRHGNGHAKKANKRDCPPAYHWNGGACVHNGKAKGHKK